MRAADDFMEGRSDAFLILYPFMWEEFGLRGNALLVYSRIYGLCKDGGRFYESRAGTASYLDISERSVIRAINDLVAKDLIFEIDGDWRRDGVSTRSYVLGRMPSRMPPIPNDNLSPPDTSDAKSDEAGDKASEEGVPDWHLKSKEESKEDR